jgi:hypothetical protein
MLYLRPVRFYPGVVQAFQALLRGMAVVVVQPASGHDSYRRLGPGQPGVVRAVCTTVMVDLVDVNLTYERCDRGFDILVAVVLVAA